MVGLLRQFAKGVVEVRENSRNAVVGGGEEHGLKLKFEGVQHFAVEGLAW